MTTALSDLASPDSTIGPSHRCFELVAASCFQSGACGQKRFRPVSRATYCLQLAPNGPIYCVQGQRPCPCIASASDPPFPFACCILTPDSVAKPILAAKCEGTGSCHGSFAMTLLPLT